jgi:hypothetical protein
LAIATKLDMLIKIYLLIKINFKISSETFKLFQSHGIKLNQLPKVLPVYVLVDNCSKSMNTVFSFKIDYQSITIKIISYFYCK